MPDWLYHLPVVWMALIVCAGTALVAAVVYRAALMLATRGRAPMLKAISPVMLTPLAGALRSYRPFICSQVWSDVHRANAAVAREASALHTVILLAASFPGETEARARTLVRRHIQDAVNQEWPAMARQEAQLEMVTAEASEVLELALSVRPQNDVQALAQREMLSASQSANDARRERIVISRSSINWVKWAVVYLFAVLILVTIAFVHIDNSGTAAVALAIFSLGVAACVVLIASQSRPFTGEISVGPELLLQVMPQ